MSNIWFTSDQHFDHKNIIEYCNRPYSNLCEMTEDIISRFNWRVKDGDTVYHLGDFCFNLRNVQPVLSRLRGRHVLIAGNHDKCFAKKGSVQAYIAAGFSEVHRRGLFLDEHELFLTHYPARVCHVQDEIKHGQPRRTHPHYGVVHGHVHDRWKYKRGLVNVGVDQQGYTPVSLEEVRHQLSLAESLPPGEVCAVVRGGTLAKEYVEDF